MTIGADFWDTFSLHDAACLIAGEPLIQRLGVSKFGETMNELPASARPVFKRLWMALSTGRAYQRGEQEYAGYSKEQTLAILPSQEGDQHLLATRAELHRWLQAVGLRSAYQFLPPLGFTDCGPEAVTSTAAPAGETAGKVQAKPLQRFAAQEEAILAALRAAGHDPLMLQKNSPGKRGVKAEIRAEMALVDYLFQKGGKIFDKAWERLRQRGEIADEA